MILGLFSEALTAGGIQRVALHTAGALDEIARATGEGTRFLSLNDARGEHVHDSETGSIRIAGCGRSKPRFTLRAIAGSAGASDVFINHVGIAPVGAAIRALRPGARAWVHLHGIEAWDPLPPIRRWLLQRVTGFFAISRFTADRAIEAQGLRPERVSVLPNAIDPALLRLANGAAGSRVANGKMLLSVARLAASERYKGVDTVIRALPALLRAHPEATYVVVGDGDDRPRLEQLARDCGVAGAVRFLGRVSEGELVSAYRTATVFVMPSRGEGLGVVYLEAMAFGVPVIGGRHGGAPEIVLHGETGYLADHDDVEGIASLAGGLLGDSDLARRMGEAGRRRVREHYTYEHFVKRLAAALSRPVAA